MATLEYLEEERKKLWSKIVELEQEIFKRTPDYENEAKQSSKKASEFRNRSEESKNAILQYLDEAKVKLEEIRNTHSSISNLKTQIDTFTSSSNSNSELIQSIAEEIEQKNTAIQSNIDEIEAIFENQKALVDKLQTLEAIFSKSDDYATKIDTVYSSLTSRKKEIDKLYYEIIGISEKDDKTGEVNVEAGLKGQLEESFTKIKENLDNLGEEFEGIKSKASSDYDAFVSQKEATINDSLLQWTTDYKSISKQISELLPKALTAGLSYAYSEKRESEIVEYSKLEKTFNKAIFGLILVSLIPFAISIYSLFEGKTLEEVITRLPRLVLAILPLYVPVLWVAHSSNKKMNLSKRLTEEYTHKEVLSKTFEGLSKQIANIENESLSEDLKIRLLYNILEVSSENPGKLITDYNKSDHPLMDALDKSVKLANAVEKLAKIPGFTKLTDALNRKSKSILTDEMKKAEAGIEMVSEENKKDEEK